MFGTEIRSLLLLLAGFYLSVHLAFDLQMRSTFGGLIGERIDPTNRYLVRSILLQDALSIERQKCEDLRMERDALQGEVDDLYVRSVSTHAKLSTHMKKAEKYRRRSLLLEEGLQSIREENEMLRLDIATMHQRIMEIGASKRKPDPVLLDLPIVAPRMLEVQEGKELLMTMMYSHTGDQIKFDSEAIVEVIDPAIIDRLDECAKDSDSQLKRALLALSSSCKELLKILLLKCVSTIRWLLRSIHSRKVPIDPSIKNEVHGLLSPIRSSLFSPPSISSQSISRPRMPI